MSVLHVQDKVFTNKGLKETTQVHVHVTQELKGGEVMCILLILIAVIHQESSMQFVCKSV